MRIAGGLIVVAVAACSDGTTAVKSTPVTLAARVPMSGGPIDVAANSAGTAYVTLGSAAEVGRFDLTSLVVGTPIAVGSAPTFVIFDPTGTTAYVSNQLSDNIGIVNVSTALQTDLIGVTGDPIPMQVTADGSTMFVTTNANKLYKITIATKAATDSLALPATSHHLLLNPNGTRLYVATRDGGSVLEVSPSNLAVLRTFPLGGRTQAMTFSPDAGTLYVANEISGVVHAINLTSGVPTASPLLDGGVNGIALTPDGSRIIASVIFVGEVQVLKRATLAVDTTLFTGGEPRAVLLDAPRQQVLVANQGGWVDVIR